MNDTIERLKETSTGAIKAFEAWDKKRADQALKEAANEAIHELRKVTSRLEIELVTSEREASQSPLPIPQHRSSMGNRAAQSTDEQ